jgi:hypothetical protein
LKFERNGKMVFYHLRLVSQADNGNIVIHNSSDIESQIMVLKKAIVKVKTTNTTKSIVINIPWLTSHNIHSIDNSNDSGLTIPLPSAGSFIDFHDVNFDLALKPHTVIPRDFSVAVFSDDGAGTVAVCPNTTVFESIDLYFNYSTL